MRFVINNADTIFYNTTEPPKLYDDTSVISWLYFLRNNLNVSVPARKGAPPGLYNIDMIFLINKNGSISDINIIEDPGYGTVKETQRLMKKSPRWTPAKYNGKPVVYLQRERITFQVTEN